MSNADGSDQAFVQADIVQAFFRIPFPGMNVRPGIPKEEPLGFELNLIRARARRRLGREKGPTDGEEGLIDDVSASGEGAGHDGLDDGRGEADHDDDDAIVLMIKDKAT